MDKKKRPEVGCEARDEGSCCKVVSLVNVDERGQMILPKDIREKAKILPGDKLALIAWEKSDEICCLTLIKAEDLGEMVKYFLGPVMADLSK